jgi:hypothetical protein
MGINALADLKNSRGFVRRAAGKVCYTEDKVGIHCSYPLFMSILEEAKLFVEGCGMAASPILDLYIIVRLCQSDLRSTELSFVTAAHHQN